LRTSLCTSSGALYASSISLRISRCSSAGPAFFPGPAGCWALVFAVPPDRPRITDAVHTNNGARMAGNLVLTGSGHSQTQALREKLGSPARRIAENAPGLAPP